MLISCTCGTVYFENEFIHATARVKTVATRSLRNSYCVKIYMLFEISTSAALPSVIRLSIILMYAGDVKLFMPLRHLASSVEFQRDIAALTDWGRSNRLPLSIRKCKIMSFTRVKNPINRLCSTFNRVSSIFNDSTNRNQFRSKRPSERILQRSTWPLALPRRLTIAFFVISPVPSITFFHLFKNWNIWIWNDFWIIFYNALDDRYLRFNLLIGAFFFFFFAYFWFH